MILIPQMYCISVYVLYIHLCFIQRTRFFSPLQSSNFKPHWKCVCISVLCSVALLCLTLCNTLDCSPPGSSVRGIFQPRILEWVAISSSRGSSQPRDPTWVSYVSCIGRWILYHWATWEAPEYAHMHEKCPGSEWHRPQGLYDTRVVTKD